MRIIKKGKLPEEEEFRVTCGHCKSILEVKRSEFTPSQDQRDSCMYIMCPICDNYIWRW